MEYCTDVSFNIADANCLPSDSYTHVSPAWGTTSWLDHIICSDDALHCLSHINILYDCILSDHHPILCNVNLDVSPDIIKSSSNELTQRIRWNELSLAMIEQYRLSTSNSLECIKVPDGIKCTDPNCKLVSHRKDIDFYYDKIISTLSRCSSSLGTKGKNLKHDHNVPGWSDNIESYHNAARDAYLMWMHIGKPRQGIIYNLMKSSRTKFKYALRKCQNNKNTILADKFATQLNNKSDKESWKEIKTKTNSRVKLPNKIDKASGDKQILQLWKAHYMNIFNCVNKSNCSNTYDELQGNHIMSSSDMVHAQEIVDIISK